MYATAAAAGRAFAQLEDRGLTREDNQINLVTPETAGSAEGLVAAIKQGLVLEADARVYAQGILRGHSLVSLMAPFGAGRMYEELLDALDPVDTGLAPPLPEPAWDDAAPLSSALGLPVILPPSPYQFMGLPAIIASGATTSAALGLGELARHDFTVFGTPRLSHDPAPFSALLHLPLLT
jgi:hypothetical protein